MELNQAQNKVIAEFAVKFCNHTTTGHVRPTCHITDVRALVEKCVRAERQKSGK